MSFLNARYQTDPTSIADAASLLLSKRSVAFSCPCAGLACALDYFLLHYKTFFMGGAGRTLFG